MRTRREEEREEQEFREHESRPTDQRRGAVTIDESALPVKIAEQEDDFGDHADNFNTLDSSLEDVSPPTQRARERVIDTSDDDDDAGTDHHFENAPSTKKKKGLGGKDEQGTKTPGTSRRSLFKGNYML